MSLLSDDEMQMLLQHNSISTYSKAPQSIQLATAVEIGALGLPHAADELYFAQFEPTEY
jgi:hypothetical protein